jgi:soluble lytic murein transglycosylase-like protein
VAALRIFVAFALLASAGAATAGPLARWAAPIAEASSRFSIPEAWIRRVIEIESNGRQDLSGRPLVSRAGAMGLMQLMPGTWHDMRALLGLEDDPQDPHDNILAGTFYLRLLYDRFGYPGLFAAYNAGPSRYSAFLAGTRPLPPETLAYLRRAGAVAGAPRLQRSMLFAKVEGLESIEPPTRAGAGPAVSAASLGSRSGGLFVPLTGSGTAP